MSEPTDATVFLRGEKVVLRLLREEDVNDRYLSWLNDGEVTKYMEAGTFPVSPGELRDFYERTSASKSDVLLAVVDKATDLHIGNIKLGGINWVHRFADLGIMIGDKRYWHKGYCQEACRLLLDHAFGRLNLQKVFLGVYGNHAAAIRAYEKVGFEIEGRIKGLYEMDGQRVDKVLMGITPQQFARA